MLTFENPLTVGTRTLYRDDADGQKFYAAGDVSYRFSRFGYPKLVLLKYIWNLQWEGTHGGGLLLFDVVLALPDDALRAIRAELPSGAAVDLLPCTGGTATVRYPGAGDDVGAFPITPEDRCAVSASLPLSMEATVHMEESLKSGSPLAAEFRLEVEGKANGTVVTRTLLVEGALPALSELQDVTGQTLRSDVFVETQEFGADRFSSPLEVEVIMLWVDDLPVDRVDVYVEPEGGAVLSHTFAPGEESYWFVAHWQADSRHYTYWYEVHFTDSDMTFKSEPQQTSNRVLVVPLGPREIGLVQWDVVLVGLVDGEPVERAIVMIEYMDRVSEVVMVTPEQPKQRVIGIVGEPTEEPYRYRVIYHVGKKAPVVRDWQSSRNHHIVV